MDTSPRIAIAPPGEAADHEAIKALFVEYAELLGFSLAYQGFDTELSAFPGKYAPPTGALLLARADGAAAGTVALRQLAPEICEMKRLYVRPAYRGLRTGDGLSIGRALAFGIAAEARKLGYRRLRLRHNRGQNGCRGEPLQVDGLRGHPALLPKPRARHRLHGAGPVTDRYYEDFKVGDRFVSGGMTMTEAGIIDFARQWDPQPFHIDVEFANKWTFGGLIASGLHTMSVTLKLWLEMGVFRAASLGSPGIGEVQFPRPVRPGDTLRVVTDIVELRLSASKPDRGIARIRQVTINQRGEQVMEQETTVFLKRRPVLVANLSARS